MTGPAVAFAVRGRRREMQDSVGQTGQGETQKETSKDTAEASGGAAKA